MGLGVVFFGGGRSIHEFQLVNGSQFVGNPPKVWVVSPRSRQTTPRYQPARSVHLRRHPFLVVLVGHK